MDADNRLAQTVLRLRETLEAQERFEPGPGKRHPTGDYADRVWDSELGYDGLGKVSVTFLAPAGESASVGHRADGPAAMEWQTDGDGEPLLRFQAWSLNGQDHRGDGPSATTRDTTSFVTMQYAWHGAELSQVYAGPGQPDPLAKRMKALVRQGAARGEAVGWLRYQQLLTNKIDASPHRSSSWPWEGEQTHAEVDEHLRTVLASGINAQGAIDLFDAGVHDAETIAMVGRDELPLSWAVAGLG